MKTENTLESKKKFIALYFGQDSVMHNFLNFKVPINVSIATFESGHIENFYLELTPLSQISKDDAFEVAKIVCARHNRHYKESEITYEIRASRGNLDIIVYVKKSPRYIVQITSDGVAFVEYEMGGASRVHHYAPCQYQVTHFLRSRGYYVGDGTEIEYGWVKLKTD